MRLLYIINGIGFASNVSLGGSDKRAMEIGLRLLRAGHEIYVLTTTQGSLLLHDQLNAEYSIITVPWFLKSSLRNGFLGRILAYLYVTLKGSFFLFDEKFDVVFPTSDFFFDVIPAISCKARGFSRKIVYIVHHAILDPIKRKGYTLRNFILFLSQRFCFILMGIFADGIFVYFTKEGDKIKNILSGFKIPKDKISSVICGIDLRKMRSVPLVEKRFVACFVGGIRPAKGLFDIVPIWKNVCANLNGSKLLIMCSGLSAYVKHLKEEIAKECLDENITLLVGHLDEGELYRNISASKVLILPSYEEGWSIIICEALSLGVPAVVYDLDVFDNFGDAILRVEKGNTVDFSRKILQLINNTQFYDQIKNHAVDTVKEFDWDKAAELDEKILKGIINE